MNKYQRTAAFEILAMFVLAGTIGFALSVIATYFTVAQTIAGLGFLVLSYCVYILYRIRVDQLRSLDEINRG